MFDQGKHDRLLPRSTPAPARPAGRGVYAQRVAHFLRLTAIFAVQAGFWLFEQSRRFILSLSGRLLILTMLFVLIVEVIILIPSLAAYQENWLNDRILKAEIASQALDFSAKNTVSKRASAQLLNSADALYMAIWNDDMRVYVLHPDSVVVPNEVLDLRQKKGLVHDVGRLIAPWQTLFARRTRLIHIEAQPQPQIRTGQLIEIVVPAEPLKQYLKANLIGMLQTSLGISIAAGVLVFGALVFAIVLPIRKLTEDIQNFKANPENATTTPKISSRHDEIGHIERELVSMQEEVRHALRSRARLAALGQAVSKINHDLRNMLTSAQMASDRLANSADPTVAKALPRLERALDRALSLAQNVLTYGKSDERAPSIQIIKLKDLAEAAAEDAGLCLPGSGGEGVRFSLKAARGFYFEADPEQMHRILVNLMRNARQAIEMQPNRKTVGRVSLTAIKTSEDVLLIVSDNGPGIPEKTREKLFQPFTSSNTPGGSGLGLAIARELAQLHGGDARLVSSGSEGTAFEVRLPLKG